MLEGHPVTSGEKSCDVVGAQADVGGQFADEHGLCQGCLNRLTELGEGVFHQAAAAWRGAALVLQMEPEQKLLQSGGSRAPSRGIGFIGRVTEMVDDAPKSVASGDGLRSEAVAEGEVHAVFAWHHFRWIKMDAEV